MTGTVFMLAAVKLCYYSVASIVLMHEAKVNPHMEGTITKGKRHGGIVGSAVASQLEGPGFDSR